MSTQINSLPRCILDIGHGVQELSQGKIASGSLVCYVDAKGAFHYGFGFRNGSNTRVACFECDERRDRTIPSGQRIIVFSEVATQGGFKRVFTSEDFVFSFLDAIALQKLQHALITLNDMQYQVPEITTQMGALCFSDD